MCFASVYACVIFLPIDSVRRVDVTLVHVYVFGRVCKFMLFYYHYIIFVSVHLIDQNQDSRSGKPTEIIYKLLHLCSVCTFTCLLVCERV